jgi:hypothetical protein
VPQGLVSTAGVSQVRRARVSRQRTRICEHVLYTRPIVGARGH